MLQINFNTGLAWVKSIEIEGDLHSDLYTLIDEYVQSHKNEFQTFSISEIETEFENEENSDDLINEKYLPINGGEYYILQIASIIDF